MTNPMKDMLEKARKSDLARQRQIAAQRESIDRLLQAREMELGDQELMESLNEENVKLREKNLELQARIDAVLRLINVTEEGAQQIRVDLVREALDA